jgi:hypothetical protein
MVSRRVGTPNPILVPRVILSDVLRPSAPGVSSGSDEDCDAAEEDEVGRTSSLPVATSAI